MHIVNSWKLYNIMDKTYIINAFIVWLTKWLILYMLLFNLQLTKKNCSIGKLLSIFQIKITGIYFFYLKNISLYSILYSFLFKKPIIIQFIEFMSDRAVQVLLASEISKQSYFWIGIKISWETAPMVCCKER